MRIISANLNGIRSAARKGFFEWMIEQRADVICMQETKAQEHQLDQFVFHPDGYHSFFHDAQKKGYSGVAIYTRHKPDKVTVGMGIKKFDDEGRYIEARFGRLHVASIYFPSGSSSELRQEVKFDFLKRMTPLLKKMRASRKHWILCGDWNIAHKQIDLKNWRSNQKNSGFLPEERQWMDLVLGKAPKGIGFVDAFRVVNPQEDQYTWWSNRGRAYEKNVGWRIDYQIVTPGLKSKTRSASIYKDQRFSDHAPLIMDYDWDI